MDKQFSRKNHFKFINVCNLVIILISVNQLATPYLPTGQSARWSPPQTIPLYDPQTWPPILVADQNRTVHALSSQWISDDNGEALRVIFYNRWTLEQGWTIPNDIIISPSKEARITDAYLDSNDMLHVVFWGGDNTKADIYYSKASAAIADDSRSWSIPLVVGEDAGDPEGAVFAENKQGDLLLIYHGKLYGNGLYVKKSQDGGDTWSSPDPIFLTNVTAPLIRDIHVIKGSNGWLNLVWDVINTGGQGRGIYYARTQNGEEWSEPVLLASAEEGYGTQTPAIIEHDGVIFVFFAGISMRQSLDNGVTWSNSVRIFPRYEGVNGSLSPVIDGNGVLHLFFGQRIPNPEIHGMWHSVWINNRWTEPEAIIKGPSVNDPVGNKSFDPFEARAVVSQGNVILVTWRTDPGVKGNGVWYSYQILDAPELPIKPLRTQLAQAINLPPTPVPTVFNQEKMSPDHQAEFNKQPPSIGYNSNFAIAMGVIPALLIVLSIVLIKLARDKSL